MDRFAAALLLTALFAPSVVQASSQSIITQQRWKVMDKCAKAAQDAFPDFNAEANAKREAKLQECPVGQNLPPRESASPGR
jgi:hypothetical protein